MSLEGDNVKIKILGTGCRKCKKMEKNAQQAINELGIDCLIEKVENIQDIVAYGVMGTPALVVDGVVKSSGKLLTVEEIKKYL